MENEKREKFLKSIKQNSKAQQANENEEQLIFIEVPKNVENVDLSNVFFNSKVQTEVYNRKRKEEQEK